MDDHPVVTRVTNENDEGSHIEPPLDQAWTDLEKLRWHASVVALDTGLQVRVLPRESDVYNVQVGYSSSGDFYFHDAWIFLTGVIVGAEQKRQQQQILSTRERIARRRKLNERLLQNVCEEKTNFSGWPFACEVEGTNHELHIDTGSMFRINGQAALRYRVAWNDEWVSMSVFRPEELKSDEDRQRTDTSVDEKTGSDSDG